MRRRRRRAHLVAWLLAACLARHAAADAQALDGLAGSRSLEHRDRFTSEDGDAVDVRFLITAEAGTQATRMVNATRAAITMLMAWFGPPPLPSLTVAGVPWRPDVNVVQAPGVVTVPVRWLSPARDQVTERALIHGLVTQYWTGGAPASTAFEEALILYTSARATHQLLAAGNFATLRFFGGMVPLPLRSVLWSPPASDRRPQVLQFEEPPSRLDSDVFRMARALQTVERYVGWPALLDALSRLRARPAHDATALAEVLSETRGTDLRFMVNECFRSDVVFDYAVADLQSRGAAGGLVETTVTIARQGGGTFTTGPGGDELMPLRTRFADGGEVLDFFDGAAPAASLVYTARTAAVIAAIDPGVMLVLDVNRQNNAIVRDAPISSLGIRLALNWMSWLQNTVLSFTAIS